MKKVYIIALLCSSLTLFPSGKGHKKKKAHKKPPNLLSLGRQTRTSISGLEEPFSPRYFREGSMTLREKQTYYAKKALREKAPPGKAKDSHLNFFIEMLQEQIAELEAEGLANDLESLSLKNGQEQNSQKT